MEFNNLTEKPKLELRQNALANSRKGKQLKKLSITKVKQTVFINYRNYNFLSIALMIALGIILFFLTITIFTDATTNALPLLTRFKNSWMRVCQMVLTGFALGIASYLFQRMTNNKLADTAIMGFGNFNLIPIAILVITTNLGMLPDQHSKLTINQYNYLMPIIVTFASILLCWIFNFVSKEKVNYNFKKLLVSGIILNFVSIAFAFSISSNGDPKAVSVVELKTIGYIGSEPTYFNFYFSGALILIGVAWIFFNSWKLTLIVQDQQIATQVGVKNKFTMYQVMVAIGLLVGGSYALSGDFVFVGLMAGNIAFKISKNKVNYGLWTSGLVGSLMVLSTYFIFGNLIGIAANILAPLIPLLISPYFLYLILTWKG